MKRIIKRWWWLMALVVLAPLVLAFVASTAATGTPADNAAFIMRFSTPVRRVLFLNNRTATYPLYLKFNDDVTTPTCSATVYDVVLDSNETLVIDRHMLEFFPVTAIGGFCASTTPTLRLTGY